MTDASAEMHAISGLMQGESSDGPNTRDKCCSDRIAPEAVRKEFNFWTDQEVWLLLEAYEDKWNQLERGNVKSKHWEEISSRLAAANQSSGSWATKTPTQCKNKIEDMKKKYRAEKAMKQSYSKWAFFQRMESMLKPGAGNEVSQQHALELDSYHHQLDGLHFRKELHEGGGNEEVDTSFTTPQQQQAQARKENGLTGLLLRCDEVLPSGKRKRSCSGEMSEVAGAIRCLGESLVRIEEAQVQLQREVARMNGEAELRRIEMEVKRTEMMLSTQLQIAKLFASSNANSSGSSKGGRKKKAARRGSAAAAAAMDNGGVASQDIDIDS